VSSDRKEAFAFNKDCEHYSDMSDRRFTVLNHTELSAVKTSNLLKSRILLDIGGFY